MCEGDPPCSEVRPDPDSLPVHYPMPEVARPSRWAWALCPVPAQTTQPSLAPKYFQICFIAPTVIQEHYFCLSSAGMASALLYSVLQYRIHAVNDRALRGACNGICTPNLTTDKDIWNSPDLSLREAKAMLREAIICFFPEKLRFPPPAPSVQYWPLDDIPDLGNCWPHSQSHADAKVLVCLDSMLELTGF